MRRKADPVKENIKRWIKASAQPISCLTPASCATQTSSRQDWRGNTLVAADPSYEDINGVLRELGKFYQSKGSRAPLSAEVASTVLAALRAAEEALVAQPL